MKYIALLNSQGIENVTLAMIKKNLGLPVLDEDHEHFLNITDKAKEEVFS